jgi:hypothetical protein
MTPPWYLVDGMLLGFLATMMRPTPSNDWFAWGLVSIIILLLGAGDVIRHVYL